MHLLNKSNFRIALLLSFFTAVVLFALTFFLGKQEFFLLANGNAGLLWDYFFAIITWLGDGLMWIAVLAITLFVLKRKDVWILLIGSFLMTTLLTQICKYLIIPDEPRPIKAIANTDLIHTVKGVAVHTVSSFPSGHTATVFCFYLIFSLLFRKRSWLLWGFIFSIVTAYSRVYLAQHFPFDLAAGIVVAIISVSTAAWLQEKRWKTLK